MKLNISIRLANWEADGEVLTAIRRQVFVDEQQVPVELELDGEDIEAQHFLVEINETTMLVDDKLPAIATARVLRDGHVGRVAVRKAYRHLGVGRALMNFIIAHYRNTPLPSLYLHSQVAAIEFYLTLGFVESGSEFLDAGIPHKLMRRKY